MIESEAVVARVEGEYAWVSIRPHTPCGSCDPETGCKTVAMSRMFSGAQPEFRVRNPLQAQGGDLVKVAIADGQLMQSALMGYGLPLTLMMLGALLGFAISPDSWVNILTFIGAGLGFVGALYLLKQSRRQSVEPQIIEKIPVTLQRISTCKNNSNS